MSDKHTPEPWHIGTLRTTKHNLCVNIDGEEWVVASMNYHMKSHGENLRRIVACVNFCAGVTSGELDEGLASFGGLRPIVSYITEQKKLRDELLAALKEMVAIHDEPAGFNGKWGKALDEAIAIQKVKIDRRLTQARAAIAKAESSSPDL